MPARLIVAGLVLGLVGAAAPGALAQAPVQQPAQEQAGETALAATEAGLQAKGEAFSLDMERMSLEIEAALAEAGDDRERARASVDAITERYRPLAEAFASAFAAFFDGHAFAAESEDDRQQFLDARDAVAPAIRAIPDQMRTSALAQIEGEGEEP